MKIVILGGSFGGLTTACELRKRQQFDSFFRRRIAR